MVCILYYFGVYVHDISLSYTYCDIGPPGQVKAIAGEKDGMKQGALGGVLKELGYTEDHVSEASISGVPSGVSIEPIFLGVQILESNMSTTEFDWQSIPILSYGPRETL